MSYPTLAECKAYLGVGTNADDTLLTDLLANAKAFIESPEGTGRAWEVTGDTTRYLDAVRDVKGRCLYLDKDLCAITTVTNGDGSIVTTSDYVTEPANETPYYALRLKTTSAQYWTWTTDPEKAISILGKWGAATAAPADIKQACLRLVAFLYRQKDSGGTDTDRAIVTEFGGLILPGAVPNDIMQVLRARRRRGL